MIRYFTNIITGTYSLARGLGVTLRNTFRPAVTIQYPSQKLPMTERFRGLVDLRTEKCISCYQCVKICPTGCLAITHMDKETPEKKKQLVTFEYNIELCCFCGFCDQVCPTQAIHMGKIYEIAVYEREKLKISLLKANKYNEWFNV